MAAYTNLGTIGEEYILEEQYKTLFGYPNGRVNMSLSSEVPGTSRPFILQNQIYSQQIPIKAPEDDLGEIISTTIGNVSVNYQVPTSCDYLKKYLEVPLGITNSYDTNVGALTWWFKASSNTTSRTEQLEYNILSRGVPTNLDPGGNYIPTLFIQKENENLIETLAFGNTKYPWTYNVNSGIVLFTGSSSSGTSNITPKSTDTITMTFWRYDGYMGISGSLGATGATGSTGAKGEQGVAGTNGSPGTNGEVGATGATGSTGAKGEQGDSFWLPNNTNTGIYYGALSIDTSATTGSIYTQNINSTGGSLTIGSNTSTCSIDSKTTFTQIPECSVGATADNQLVNKYYVDSKTYQILNFSPTEVTSIKKSIIYRKATTITSSSILAKLDNAPTIPQVYTFGKQIENLWVAGGNGSNKNFAWSKDGIIWTASASAPFGTSSGSSQSVAWNGQMWVAGGGFSNNTNKNFAWSDDGKIWTASANIIFVTGNTNYLQQGVYSVAWNGQMWVAGGHGSSKNFAWSTTGKSWFEITSTPFGAGYVYSVAWNGQMWVAGGGGNSGNSINFAWSDDGQIWNPGTGVPFSFSNSNEGARSVVWNGQMWVAGGHGNSINFAWSDDGKIWSTSTSTPFGTGYVYSVAWNGQMWVAGGTGNSINFAWSINGKSWSAITSAPFGTSGTGYGVAFNSARPNTITFDVASGATGTITPSNLNISLNSGDQLDVVCDSYYNTGFTNCSISIDN